ncbi:hypothetical protein NEOC84_001670|nr:hypothetical protein [Neochlamydia sp. AcF95]NGY95745.1 hypothetical protein [Neochlamydia sp. AcF84]
MKIQYLFNLIIFSLQINELIKLFSEAFAFKEGEKMKFDFLDIYTGYFINQNQQAIATRVSNPLDS